MKILNQKKCTSKMVLGIVPLLSSVSVLCIASSAHAQGFKKADEVLIKFAKTTEGRGGGPWVYETADNYNRGVITKIEVCHGRFIDSITPYYDNFEGTKLGGQGGACEFFNIPENQYIEQVIVWHGDWINAISFVTNGASRSADDPKIFGNKDGGVRKSIQDPNRGALRKIDGKFGSFLNQVKLSFGLPYRVANLVVRLDENKKDLDFAKPDTIDSVAGDRCDNWLNSSPRFKKTFTKTVSDSHTFSFNSNTKIGLSASFKVGLPIIADGKVTASVEQSFNFGTSDTSTTTNTVTQGYDFTVPDGKRVDAAFTAKSAEVNVPFSYDVIHFRNGDPDDIVQQKTYQGTYNGVLFTSSNTVLYDVDCKTGKRVIRTADSSSIDRPPNDDIAETKPKPKPPRADDPSEDTVTETQAIQPLPPESDSLTENLTYVSISNGGAFQLVEEDVWQELSQTGDARFTFDVYDRDEDCIYLLDRDRGVIIIIDVRRNKIGYAPDESTDPFDIYDITGIE
ncbi:MAG: ETX/MTX2 family pore-forming toxin [Parasphingorhabdus sp.]|uniref:ETX/MTX2 family pore-forming toxin n=1 Tax=Parasphingorhabdus sp. TaxID=2709688 RepID=UPI003297B8A9